MAKIVQSASTLAFHLPPSLCYTATYRPANTTEAFQDDPEASKSLARGGEGGGTMGNGGSRTILYGGALLVGLAYLAQPMRIGIVRGESMEPTLRNGQPYVLNTRAYKTAAPQRGEVVVFRRGDITYIKRVAAVGGDSLLLERIRGAKEDELVTRSEVSRLQRLAASTVMPGLVTLRSITIPADSIYVVGDCTQLSRDSREFGPIPISSILGQVPAPPAPTTRPLAADFRPHTTL